MGGHIGQRHIEEEKDKERQRVQASPYMEQKRKPQKGEKRVGDTRGREEGPSANPLHVSAFQGSMGRLLQPVQPSRQSHGTDEET